MSSSKIVMVLGLALIAGFFLPWVSLGGEQLSGYSFAMGWIKGEYTVMGSILMAAPVGAFLAAVLGAAGKPHGIVSFLTGLICPAMIGLFLLGAEGEAGALMKNSATYGVWIVLAASALLVLFAFTKSDSKRAALNARR